MSIRSVDMMVSYSKTADVEKAQQTEQQSGRVANENVAAQEMKKKKNITSQVQKTHEDEQMGKIQEDPEQKQGQKGARGEEEEEEEQRRPAGNKFSASPHTGAVDITI